MEEKEKVSMAAVAASIRNGDSNSLEMTKKERITVDIYCAMITNGQINSGFGTVGDLAELACHQAKALLAVMEQQKQEV
jgi:hypothetical protein